MVADWKKRERTMLFSFVWRSQDGTLTPPACQQQLLRHNTLTAKQDANPFRRTRMRYSRQPFQECQNDFHCAILRFMEKSNSANWDGDNGNGRNVRIQRNIACIGDSWVSLCILIGNVAKLKKEATFKPPYVNLFKLKHFGPTVNSLRVKKKHILSI